MGVALAAEADDRDLLGLDQVHIRITVVVNAHLSLWRTPQVRKTPIQAVRLDVPRTMATAPVRDTSASPIGRIRLIKASSFSPLPVISKTKLSVVASTTRAR
jgi:hypothetical protein